MIAGVILTVLGTSLTILGFYLNTSMEAQLNALFESGNVDPGTAWIVVGVICLAAGIALLIIEKRKKSDSLPDDGRVHFFDDVLHKDSLKHKSVCPYCENVLPLGVGVCPACGNRVDSSLKLSRPAPAPSDPKPAYTSPDPPSGWKAPSDSDL